MKLSKDNLWDSTASLTLVTGNSTVKSSDNCLVMGRGAALEAMTKHPTLPATLGSRILRRALPWTAVSGKFRMNAGNFYGVVIAPYERVGVFQVKFAYDAAAELDIIKVSTYMLQRYLTGESKCPDLHIDNITRIAMNFPGIGAGRLREKRDEILEIISVLPDTVTVYERT